jgi:hypothetical protein
MLLNILNKGVIYENFQHWLKSLSWGKYGIWDVTGPFRAFFVFWIFKQNKKGATPLNKLSAPNMCGNFFQGHYVLKI